MKGHFDTLTCDLDSLQAMILQRPTGNVKMEQP